MTRLLLASMRSITVIVLCTLLLTGCSSLLIHDDDNIGVVAGKVAVRTVNCALTIFSFCMSEWWFMQDAYNATLVWYGTGDINGDNYKCQQEASSSSSGATGYIHMPVGANVMSIPMDDGGGRQINQQLYHSCMRARGYTLHDGYELNRWREKQANASIRAPQGSLCAASNTTIGTRLKPASGKMVKVTALYGNSPRCSDPATPILVDVEDVGEEESSVRASQSEQDSAAAQTNRGLQYYNGQGVPQDYVQARQWYEKAAAQGNASAQNNLGVLYAEGQGVPQDYVQARQWYEKAAAQGNASAQNNLGTLYFKGQGVLQDYVMARGWFEKAAAQGNEIAKGNLALLNNNGQGLQKDSAAALANLGLQYYSGKGVPQDYVMARGWFEKAAAQGNASAQFMLGIMHDNGQGVSKDYAMAREWYELAAVQGYADAQNNLGALYDNGRGVLGMLFHFGQGIPQDYAKAREWYEKAAAQGNGQAQSNLGLQYQHGRGVPQDYVRAYMWYNLAAPQLMGEKKKAAEQKRDKIAGRMTPAQIAEAQRLSQQCQAQQFKGC